MHNFLDWITGLLNFSAETCVERLTTHTCVPQSMKSDKEPV